MQRRIDEVLEDARKTELSVEAIKSELEASLVKCKEFE
jgi:hypothetical protein